MDYFSYLSELLKNTSFYNYFVFLTVVAGSVALIVVLVNFANKNPYRISLLLLFIGLLAISVIYFVPPKENYIAKTIFLIGTGLAIAAIISILFYIICSKLFISRLKKYSTFNYIRAINLINNFHFKNFLTIRQKYKFYTYYIFILVKLGNIFAAEKILNDLTDEQKSLFRDFDAVSLLVAEMKAFESGNTESIYEICKKVNELITFETDKLYYLELQCNLAVSYIFTKRYNDADELLRKLVLQAGKIRSKDFLNILFTNYCLNKLNLKSDSAENDAWNVLLEYKKHLKLKKYSDYVDYMNLEIEVLRTIGADIFRIEKNINDSLLAVSKMKLSKLSKAFYDASVARMVWAHRTSPELVLELLDKDLVYLQKLPVPEKYYAFKHIDLFFRDLRGDIVQIYGELKKSAHQYIVNHALHDMTSYLDSLSINAIKERAATQHEIISILKNDDRKYDFNFLKEKFETIINLCKENHLNLMENKYRMDLIDEATELRNFEKNGKLKYHDYVISQLAILEEYVPSIGSNIDVAEFGARMACFYYCVGDKEKFISSFKYYESAQVNKNIFAPWLRDKILVCSYLSALYKVEIVLQSLLTSNSSDEIAITVAVADYLNIKNAGLKIFSINLPASVLSYTLLLDLDNGLVIDFFHKRLGNHLEPFFVGLEGTHILENTNMAQSFRFVEVASLQDEKLLALADRYYSELKKNV